MKERADKEELKEFRGGDTTGEQIKEVIEDLVDKLTREGAILRPKELTEAALARIGQILHRPGEPL